MRARTVQALTTWLVPLVLFVSPIAASELDLIDFEMEDQFKNVHRREEYDGRVVVVIGSDNKGSEFNVMWGAAIGDSLGDAPGFEEVAFLPVADVRGVPFFVKRFVRGKFPKDPEKWALVDWDGKFAKAYDWRPDVANVIVFGPDGARAVHAFGKDPHPEAIGMVVAALRVFLGITASSEPEREAGAEKADEPRPSEP